MGWGGVVSSGVVEEDREAPARAFLPTPRHGRRYRAERTVRLGDVDRDGELRLDSVGRYLQDVATDDARDAGLDNALGWLVRRTMIRVEVPARLDERVELVTFCTGSGRSWAERRTTVRGADGAVIDGVSLWVQIDVDTGRPSRLGDDFHAIYGEAAAGRVVSSKLALPRPPSEPLASEPWTFRITDIDPFDHVNNAAQWALVEELLARRALPRIGTGEVEYLAPSDPAGFLVISDDGRELWFGEPDRITTACRWTPRAATDAT